MDEVRYAILIGIDYYENDIELNYCSSDVLAMKESLINSCKFKEENIKLIISNKQNKETELVGKYLQAIKDIGVNFKAGKDSILFFFAGHGGKDGEDSLLKFNDTKYKISDVFSEVSTLKPKIQSYIIDACHSGGKVLTRSSDFNERDYIDSSEGVVILYACQQHQVASEDLDLKHGILTDMILKAIKEKSLYDQDGILTFNVINDYVSKNLVKNSCASQVPVMENRIIGFYPFAFLNNNNEENLIHDETELIDNKDGKIVIEELANYREGVKYYSREMRLCLQAACREKNDSILERIKLAGYNITEYNDFDFTDVEYAKELQEKIINYTIDKNLKSIRNLLSKVIKQNPKAKNAFAVALSGMINEKIPEYIEEYEINLWDEYICVKFKIFKSEDIKKVSFGVGYVIYQSRWGVINLNVEFLIDWNGEEDTNIKNVKISSNGFVLEQESLEKIRKKDEDKVTILELKEIWDEERYNEINAFRNIAD
ncbi:caspase family protein [Clostridium gasigenes]|uniref:caspase family protein n=1 Tax=Clostridium gasigenes TaxID=94869 RepID=UPI00143827A2|nr:caspase family protein [Clostridium gasigenes]NKF05693.1 caspase family protein [Clostridium gasigenes]QSW19127.1 caspase family protein [Clostridium gasigenes]